MSKFLNVKISKLRNIGLLRNQKGSKKNDNSSDIELTKITTEGAGPSTSRLKIKEILIENCDDLQYALKKFESKEIEEELIEPTRVLLLKIQINERFPELNQNELQEVTNKCISKSIVVCLTIKDENDVTIFWKSKDIDNFLILKHDNEIFTEHDNKVYKFVTEFLAKSLSRGELGLLEDWSIHSNSNKILPYLISDSRQYNLLLVAAEAGNAEIVDILLDKGADIESLDGLVNAQTLALKGGHFNVLVVLANANVMFPEGIDIEKSSEEFKIFYKPTEELHDAILSNNPDKVKAILSQNKNLKYYFNLNNESAAKVSIMTRAFDIYEILSRFEIFCTSEEEEIFKNLDHDDQEVLRELHNKLSKDLLNKHINVLMANSFVGHDVPDAQEKLKHVHEAYKFLCQDPRTDVILKAVAACKKFKIIYDFNRDAVNIADPTLGENTEGVFYPMGRIYIGARQLLDEENRNQAIATLAHELCHFAMNLTFNNDAKPYRRNDHEIMEEYERINEHCMQYKDEEYIVGLVYYEYHSDMYHAELIVRIPHMLAQYRDQPEKIERLMKIFRVLFDFYEKFIVPAIEEAIPEIEAQDEKEREQREVKISKLRRNLVLTVILSIFGIILAAVVVGLVSHKPFYSFKELSDSDKLKVKNGLANYKNVKVKLYDLFPDDSIAFKNLTSDHISNIFNGKSLDFCDPHLQYLDDLVHHSWMNLTKSLKRKFLSSNITFQNESLQFEKLHEIIPKAFTYLTSEQITDVLDGKHLIVGKMIENATEFYLERKLIFEDIKFGYIFRQFVQTFKNSTYDDVVGRYPYFKPFIDQFHLGEILRNYPVDQISIQDIYAAIPFLEFDKYLKVIQVVEKIGTIKDYEHFLKTIQSEYTFLHYNFDKVAVEAEKFKLFILSSEAGAGKTVTYEQLAMRLKKKFPTRWISYIDLKEHTALYSKKGNLKKLLLQIFGLGHNIFEMKVFEELYKSNNAVLLWNGFDEISPNYSDFITLVLNSIYNSTRNIQYVSTRPLFSSQLRDKFQVRTFQLIPYTKADQEEFLTKFFESKNVEKSKIDENIVKIRRTIKGLGVTGLTSESRGNSRDFNTPLMLRLVAEIYVDDDKIDAENFYEIYRKFVMKKVGVWQKNSPLVDQVVETIITTPKLNVMEIFHKYALPLELFESLHLELYFDIMKLKVMSKPIPTELSNNEISRMGILHINDETRIEFAHKTLSEFFTAQYLIENIYDAEYDVSYNESYYRLEIFFFLAQNYGYNQFMVTDFMKSFLLTQQNVAKSFSREMSMLLKTKYKKFLFDLVNPQYLDILRILLDFFKKDHEVLLELLHVNDDETLYTASFNPNYFVALSNPVEIKKIVKSYLSDEEFKKFVSGKNQKGKIQLGQFHYGQRNKLKIHDDYKLDLDTVDEVNFWDFADDLSQNLTQAEQKEFFLNAISPAYYSAYALSELPRHEQFWINFQQLLTNVEIKEAIANVIEKLIRKYPERNEMEGPANFIPFLLEKADELLTSSEIFEMYLSQNILPTATHNLLAFDVLWKFLENHTNDDQRRKILRKEDEPRYYQKHDSYHFYHNIPLTVIHKAALRVNQKVFVDVKRIYKQYFSIKEIQEIVTSSDDFLLHFVISKKFYLYKTFTDYFEDLFEGDVESLRKFLYKKVKLTEKSAFDHFKDIPVEYFGRLDDIEKIKLKIGDKD